MHRVAFACVTSCAALFAFAAVADDGTSASLNDRALGSPTDFSFYIGPSTTKHFFPAFGSFNMRPTGVMAGLAVDHRFLYLGWGTWLSGEVEGTQWFFGHKDTSYGVGLGFQINDPFGFRHASLSIYDGPSWDTNPSPTSIGYHDQVFPQSQQKFLNYVRIEEAIALSRSGHWDGVISWYHRSGMWGVYNPNSDGGMAFGLGVRYRM